MKKRSVSTMVLAATMLVVGMANAFAADFTIKSSSFADFGPLPKSLGGAQKGNASCKGENISPAVEWSNAPAGTKSFVVLMQDPQGLVGQGVSLWVAYGIAATVSSIPEGEGSRPSTILTAGKTQLGLPQYNGPCPQPGTGLHHIVLVVIATDLDPTALTPGLSREEVLAAVKGHGKAVSALVAKASFE